MMPETLPADPSPGHRISLARIAGAAEIIDPLFLNTPQYALGTLNETLGCELVLKIETQNPIRSFKGRGAGFLVHELQRTGRLSDAPLVSASAGNWGQALAHACGKARQKLILFASHKANPMKVARMKALGADVRLAGDDFDASKLAAAAFAADAGFPMVADGLNVEASEGAGTIAMELARAEPAFDAVLIPLGNGALLTGMGRWLKAVSPATRVIGVSARGADAMEKSWRGGELVLTDNVSTIADGIGVRVPIAEAVADMQGTVDDVMLVDDESLVRAMQLLFKAGGVVAEPSAAAGVAAVLNFPGQFRGKRIATVITGSNLTEQQIKDWLF